MKQKRKSYRRGGNQAPLPKLMLQPLQEFFKAEASGGIVLMLVALLALLLANSNVSAWFFSLWETPVQFRFGDLFLDKPLILWINDGLMAVFFLFVGLEIKRELMVGELSDLRQAAFPVFAAIGGMVVPAGLYFLVNTGGEGSSGWGIPMATDIAFALGILMLMGDRVPVQLKIFLTALAIVDDLGAVTVIALFYTSDVLSMYLWWSLGVVLLLMVFNRAGLRKPIFYILPGVVLWYLVLKSGVHATVSGVVLAMLIPSKARINAGQFVTLMTHYKNKFLRSDKPEELVMANQEQTEALQAMERLCHRVETPMQRIEHALAPWVVWLIMPLFALANAGIWLGGESLAGLLANPVSMGIVLGLVVGKPLGIYLFTRLAVAMGWAGLPEGVNWNQIVGVGFLAGVGFTMSIFIAALAFDSALLVTAKVGIIGASILAAIIGSAILMRPQYQGGHSEQK